MRYWRRKLLGPCPCLVSVCVKVHVHVAVIPALLLLPSFISPFPPLSLPSFISPFPPFLPVPFPPTSHTHKMPFFLVWLSLSSSFLSFWRQLGPVLERQRWHCGSTSSLPLETLEIFLRWESERGRRGGSKGGRCVVGEGGREERRKLGRCVRKERKKRQCGTYVGKGRA